jgi:hypothetical protein
MIEEDELKEEIKEEKEVIKEIGNDILEKLENSRKSVVKLFVTSSSRSYSSPWKVSSPKKSTSSAFIIDIKKKLILTNVFFNFLKL